MAYSEESRFPTSHVSSQMIQNGQMMPSKPRSTSSSSSLSESRSPIRRKPLPASASVLPPTRSDSLRYKKDGFSAAVETESVLPVPDVHERQAVNIVDDGYFAARPYSYTVDNTNPPTAYLTPLTSLPPNSLPRIAEESRVENPSRQRFWGESGSGNRQQTNDSLIGSLSRVGEMALKLGHRPAPLRMDSSSSTRSMAAAEIKKPMTPGAKFTSFFSRNRASPSVDSSATEITDSTKSPNPSSYPPSPGGVMSPQRRSGNLDQILSQSPHSSIDDHPRIHAHQASKSSLSCKCSQLETELREITTELAGSIKREMDLEDMVEKYQTDASSVAVPADRTSDYFSDSGTSSVRANSEMNAREEMAKIKREAEQQRAQLRIEMTEKWQAELHARKTMESHVQILESKLSDARHTTNESSDMTARSRELELALEDAKRRLVEERKTKENFEDLLTALRVELQQERNQRDNLRDEVVPKLRAQIEGLEASLAEAQKSPYDVARMQQEMQILKDENLALGGNGARGVDTVGEDVLLASPRNSFLGKSGLSRSNTVNLNRTKSTTSRNRSSSISRTVENGQALSDQLKAIEMQRDALHSTVRSLIKRNEYQVRTYEKKLQIAEADRNRANNPNGPRRGYEHEVGGLRSEINLLRKRTEDALEQKWQCEKGLAGLALDLDRSRQETARLQHLLQARDSDTPEALSASLQQSFHMLEKPSAALAKEVESQMSANAALKNRLREAIEEGERNQQRSKTQINELQDKLRKLEDVITSAQIQSETAVMKHEEEIRMLKASHNAHLLRTNTGLKSPILSSPGVRSPMSPLFANRTPKLDKTSTGPGIALHEALRTEHLERKVASLEQALVDAEREMQQVVGRMNSAQIGAAELEAERDEALRRSKRLEAAIIAEREKSR